MIIIFYNHTRKEIRKILESKKLLTVDDEVHTIDPTVWTQESVDELTKTKGLFSSREIFFVDHVLSELEPDEIYKEAKILSESENIAVFLESESIKGMGQLEKFAKFVFKAQTKTKAPVFNVFSLTDALFEKDRKKLWLLYQKTILEGLDLEFEVHKILFWGVKMLALAKNYNSAVSAGISPFVFSKAKKGTDKFEGGEIEKVSQNLTEMTIRARQGEDWEILLEQFVLSI